MPTHARVSLLPSVDCDHDIDSRRNPSGSNGFDESSAQLPPRAITLDRASTPPTDDQAQTAANCALSGQPSDSEHAYARSLSTLAHSTELTASANPRSMIEPHRDTLPTVRVSTHSDRWSVACERAREKTLGR